jgi:Tol biopolymer transport system component
MGLAAALAVLAAALAWLLFRPVPAPQAHRYALSLPPSQTPAVTARFAISPDGTRLAYSGPGPNGTQIWVKFRDRYEAVPVAGTGNAASFTFSPDGESLAFLEGPQVKRIAVAGGAALVLADSAMPARGVAWLDSDEIVYTTTAGRSLRTVPAAGGASEDLWSADSGSGTAILPVAIPGERAVLFGLCSGGLCGIAQDLTYLDLERREPRLLAPGIAGAAVTATGQLIYVRRDGAMLAAPFDAGRGEMTGPGVPVLDSVMVVQGVVPLFALSRTGTLVVRPGASTRSERYELIWVDRGGRESAIDSSWQFRHVEFGENVGWALSPDGRRVAIGLATASGDDIWIKQLPRGPLSRLSFDSLPEYRPRWKPDGRSVMYIANVAGSSSANLYERSADLTGAARLVHDAERGIYEGVWSRDGRWLAIRTGGTVNQVGGRDILALRPGVDSAPIPLMASTEFDESSIALSPDGRWIAYESNETGRQEVYLRPFPEVDRGKRQVSTAGGTAPLWSRDGRELFFVSGDRRMSAVQVSGDGVAELSEPEELFRLAEHVYLVPGENYTPYDVGPDGRFIMARRIRSTEVPAPLLVAEGWAGEIGE